MGYKYKNDQGDVPGYGAIFMSNSGTKKECFQRKLLGLPLAQSNFVLNVKKGMILFLFEFERRQLHGVFRATSNGEIDIEPNAFRSSGKQFPAQVRFTPVWNCKPLFEDEFQDAIIDNYFSGKKFKFGLSKDQVYKLVTLFHSKRIPKTHPERSLRRYDDDDDKEAEGDERFRDNRKRTIRDRIRFVKQEDDSPPVPVFEPQKVDVQGYNRTPMAHKDNREGVLQDFCDRGSRQLEKHFNHDNDEYLVTNGFSQSISSHNLDRRNQMIEDGGGYFGHETVERELKGTSDVWVNPNSYEPRASPYEQRGTNISHFNQYTSDFIPIPEVTDHYPHPFEFDNTGITNTYELGFPYSVSSDPSMVSMDTPYNPEVPEFCHKPSSYFAPGPCSSSPINNQTLPYQYHSENKHSEVGKLRSQHVRKVSVFDRLTSAPKSAKVNNREQDAEKDELDASVDKVMKMLEKIVSSPIKRTGKRQSSSFKRKRDDDYSETVDNDFPNIEEEYEGESAVVEETRVVDFKRRKKTNKNLDDDESKEGGTESDVGRRRKLVRPLFVKKESADETRPLKVEKNNQDQKSSTQGEVEENPQVLEEQQPQGSDDVAQVESSKDDSKTCGWIEG